MERRTTSVDRRAQTITSVLYGGIYPRRSYNRRPADDQHFIVDLHDKGLFLLAMAIIVMSLTDAFFTLNLLAMGAQELNYFMQALIERGATSFLTTKLMITGTGVLLLVAYAKFRLAGLIRVRRVLEILCGIYACLIVWELYLLVIVAAERIS